MGSSTVYHSLLEVFQQVDTRILKAVAIEHSKDVDVAVESMFSEVLSCMQRAQKKVLLTLADQEVKCVSVESAESEKLSFSLERPVVAVEANVSPLSKSRCLDGMESACSVSVSCVHERYEDQFNTEIETELSSSEKHQGFIPMDVSNPNTIVVSSSLRHEHCGVDGQDSVAVSSHNLPDLCFSQYKINPLSDVWSDTNLSREKCFPAPEQSQLSLEDAKVDALDSATMLEQEAKVPTNDSKKGEASGSLGDATEGSFPDSGLLHFDNDCRPPAMASHSGQTLSVDFLEEIMIYAKNYKKTLSSSMKSLMSMVREVELKENATDEAKQEASRAGLDILGKVEGLRSILRHAKEANEMHAGEVYGEKSILTTEARELQSRLLTLSDQRDRFFSIIDEICHKLEVKLAVAEAEKAAAEQEKLQKEKAAHETLIEQDHIMDTVIQKSKKLQQEAEENTKLREFLMDSGLIVDTLQGEMAVICEDVKLLKEKIDGHLPIGKRFSARLSWTLVNDSRATTA